MATRHMAGRPPRDDSKREDRRDNFVSANGIRGIYVGNARYLKMRFLVILLLYDI